MPEFRHNAPFSATTYRIHFVFITASAFAASGYAPLLKPGQAAWHAVGLSTRFAWFIVTSKQLAHREPAWTDILVSDSIELCALFESPDPPSIASIHMVSVQPSTPTVWQCQRADQVWRATNGRTGLPVVFFANEEGEFCQELFDLDALEITDLTLVADLTKTANAV